MLDVESESSSTVHFGNHEFFLPVAPNIVHRKSFRLSHIWTPPDLQARDPSDERGVAVIYPASLLEPCWFRALRVVARQLLNIPTACLCSQ